MDIEVMILIDKDLYDIFQIVLKKSNHNEKDIIENYLIAYMTSQMEKDKKKDLIVPKNENYSYNSSGKANDRIPIWANKPNQYNHKIIRAYFKLLESSSGVTLYNMELLCSDKSKQDLYVPTFRSNYAAMKLDNGNSHGKVFEDDGKFVRIWPGVEATLMRYKQFFE